MATAIEILDNNLEMKEEDETEEATEETITKASKMQKISETEKKSTKNENIFCCLDHTH